MFLFLFGGKEGQWKLCDNIIIIINNKIIINKGRARTGGINKKISNFVMNLF